YGLLAGGVVNCGLTVAYNRNYFQYRQDKLNTSRLLTSVLAFVAAAGTVLGLVTFVLRDALSGLFIRSPHHGDLLFWAFAANLLINLKTYPLLFLRNEERARDFVFYSVLAAALYLAASVGMVVVLKSGVIGLVISQAAVYAVVLALALGQCYRQLPVSFDGKILRDALGIGSPLLPTVFLGTLGNNFDKYMIGLLGTMGGVGVYSIGQKIAALVFTLMTSLQNVFSPQIYKRMFDLKGEEGAKSVGRYLTPFAYAVISAALLMSLCADELVWLLTPPNFHGAADVMRVLVLYYAVLFFAKINGEQLVFARKTHLTTALFVAAMALNVGLNIPFILTWGAIGAAWATLIARMISGAVIFAVAQRHYPVRWEYGRLAFIFGVLFVSAVGIIVMKHAGAPYPFLAGCKAAALAAYAAGGVRLGILTKDYWDAVKNLVPGIRKGQ
ncbi:MAG: oligosaccharide flippase family protein, partial [Candidatus Omnitrophota bacterium]|nr:oligosaccharide flippase family protein [Candidatus Omnitrophota bacterium]